MDNKDFIDNFFRKEIQNKYHVYNSLFTNLPYSVVKNIGILLPILEQSCKRGLAAGLSPLEIIRDFFAKHVYVTEHSKQIDILFLFIQFIERQVVLFDSIEDASCTVIQELLRESTLEDFAQFIPQNSKQQQTIKEKLATFRVRVVFTAHPTQFYPNNVLRIIHDLAEAVKRNDITEIDILLKQLGQTPFMNRKKPTPEEEAMSIMYYMEHVYYESISRLNDRVHKLFFDGEEEAFIPVIELGFWPGGDRDGNPFVNAATTLAVSEMLLHSVLRRYYRDLKRMCKRITFLHAYPPLHQLCQDVYQQMVGKKTGLTAKVIIEKLYHIRSIIHTKHYGFFIEMIDSLIRKVKTFGLHFASLDIRQDSSIHHKLMEHIVDSSLDSSTPYSEMKHSDKVKFLLSSSLHIKEDDFEDVLFSDTIATIKQIQYIQEKKGDLALHRYIISNTTSIFQVLEVMALFRFSGCTVSSMDITPLFESIASLQDAAVVMEELYKLPEYQKHLERRNKVQYVMLGFSDGTKDGGYVQSAWSIFRTKEEISKVSKAHGILVIFFDGRGGPPSRGGGKTHQFYASQGKTVANNGMHLTLQGQTITSQYGSVVQATYNFSQLLTAGLRNDFSLHEKSSITHKGRLLIDKLAKLSYEKYSCLKAHPLFLEYLEKKSTLRYYGRTNIGSRPSRRKKNSKLSLNDLRAIPFVGSWSQLKQNVPGYYGFGYALQVMIEEGSGETLQSLYQDSLYFRTLAQNSMMSLAKTYFPLTSYMKEDKVFGDFWKMLHKEYKASLQCLLFVSQQNNLMECEPFVRLSIEQREKIVLPLQVIQQYALQRLDEDEQRRDLEKIVMRTMFGCINASRNSA